MKKLIFTLLTVALVASCSKSEQVGQMHEGTPQPITFGSTIDIGTKAVGETDEQFTNGETIRVLGYRSTAAGATTDFSAPFMNATFTYASPNFTSTDAAAYWQLGQAHNFYAYYPLTLVPVNDAAGITAPITVTAVTGIAEDVMTAISVGTAIYNGTVREAALPFEHRLSKVKFKILKDANLLGTTTLSNIEFKMAKDAGSVNIATGMVTNSGSSVTLSKALSHTITTMATDAGGNWMVLPADQISDVILTINNIEMKALGALTTVPTVAGEITTLTATVKADGITLTSSIEKWGTDPKPADKVEPVLPPPPINSIIFATAINNFFGIPGPTQNSYNTWKGAAMTPGVNGGNGQSNPDYQWFIDNEPPYYQFEVALTDEATIRNWTNARIACWNKTTDGGGWRLPRLSELCMMWSNQDQLLAAGVTAFNGVDNSTGYWASSEHDNDFSHQLEFADGSPASNRKTSLDGSVRCVREF